MCSCSVQVESRQAKKVVLPGSLAKPFRVLLYYQYVRIEDPEAFRAAQEACMGRLGLRGRVIVSREGINGTISGKEAACHAYMELMWSDDRFASMVFKTDECEAHVFSRVRVRVKAELVHGGMGDISLACVPRGEYIDAQDFRGYVTGDSVKGAVDSGTERLSTEPSEVLILDVRSRFEHALGYFRGAFRLPIDYFREFFRHHESLDKYKEKTVITYCTGGIRCEKASAFLRSQGFRSVYQLRDGILGYGSSTDGAGFKGSCYVFDERLSVPINRVDATVVGVCYRCEKACSRMVNCADPVCNRHMILCESCGWRWEGTCSARCYSSPRRVYSGTGSYRRSYGESRDTRTADKISA